MAYSIRLGAGLLLIAGLALAACSGPNRSREAQAPQPATNTATATVTATSQPAGTAAPIRTAQPGETTAGKPDYPGIWSIWGSGVSKAGRPWYKGHVIAVGWEEIETADNRFNWTKLDKKIDATASQDLYIMVLVYTGNQNPEWLYATGVPRVETNYKNGSSYAYYVNDNNGDGDGDDRGEFRYYFKRMIAAVAQHLNELNTDKTRASYGKIIGIQGPVGASGDPHPYTVAAQNGAGAGEGWFGAGTPYEIKPAVWDAYQREMFSYYYDQYKNFQPRLHVLLNTGDTREMHDWALANLPGIWIKYGRLGDRYQNNKEWNDPNASSGAWLWETTREFRDGSANRSRSEMDLTNQGWFTEAPAWNMYWTNLWDLHTGMDMHNITNADLENPAYVETFTFFSKYAGYKDPRDSTGVWIALRDGLDVDDTQRFPEQTYGPVEGGKNRQRYLNILDAFKPYGAQQNDLDALNKTSWNALNDVGYRVYPGNYQLWLYQKTPNETSQGLWRVGPADQPYGRFARRFDQASGKKTMYFDIDDRFFFNKPLNGAYPISIRVVYLDQGTGTWALRYDAIDDAQKTAFTVTKTNSGRWKEQTITLSDGYFGNRAPNSSDLVLDSVDSEDDTFHMIELTRATGYRIGVWGDGEARPSATPTP